MADIGKDFDAHVAQDEQPVVITVEKPNGDLWLGADGKPSTLIVVGEESKTYKRRYRDLERNIKKVFEDHPEIHKEERFSIMAAMAGTVGWSGWELDGVPAAFNTANQVTLFRLVHIRGAALVQIRKHSDFFGSENSLNGQDSKDG